MCDSYTESGIYLGITAIYARLNSTSKFQFSILINYRISLTLELLSQVLFNYEFIGYDFPETVAPSKAIANSTRTVLLNSKLLVVFTTYYTVILFLDLSFTLLVLYEFFLVFSQILRMYFMMWNFPMQQL
jgi:superfamily II DNA or RNA helicase